MEYLIIFLCIPLFAVNAFCDKYASDRFGSRVNVFYNILKFAAGAVILLPPFWMDGAKWQGGVLLCGILCGVMFAANKLAVVAGYERSSVAFITICHSSGMLLPCIFGHFLWGEQLTFPALMGMILVIVSILLLKDTGEKKEGGAKSAVLGIAVLVTSGGLMILQKIIGIYFHGSGVSAFNFYSFLSAFFILLCLPGRRTGIKTGKKLFLCAAGSAVSVCVVSIAMTYLSAAVPSVILFPLFNGSGIILVALLSAVFFHEKLTKKKCLGILLGLTGLFLNSL